MKYEIIRFPSGRMMYRESLDAPHKYRIATVATFKEAWDYIIPCDPYGKLQWMAGTSEDFITWDWHLYRGMFRLNATINLETSGYTDTFFDECARAKDALPLWASLQEGILGFLEVNEMEDLELARSFTESEKSIQEGLTASENMPDAHFWDKESAHENVWQMRDSVTKGYYLLEA